MPKSSPKPKVPNFANEYEEADWYASPAGRRFITDSTTKARKRGVIVVEDRSPEAARKAREESKRTGKLVRSMNGTDIKRTDPAKLRAIMDRVKAKSELKMIALRLSAADIDAAKRIAERHGVGYQTLLKEIIHDALKAAS